MLCLGVRGGQFQELDAATLIRPIAKWTACAHQPGDIPRLLREAVRGTRSCRPGPVYLDLPEDVLGVSIADPGPLDPLVAESFPLEDPIVDRVARCLEAARSPVLILGDGVRWHVDPARVRPWLENLPLPVVSLPLLRGLLPETHPWAVADARCRSRVLAQADLVLLLGADLDWCLRLGAEIGREAQLIFVDDTPEPSHGLAGRGEWLAVDAGLLLNRLSQHPPACPSLPKAMPDASQPAGVGSQGSTHAPSICVAASARLSIREVFETVQMVMPADAFLHLDPGWNGCMGTGIPFALAARLHHPSRPVLVVRGGFRLRSGCDRVGDRHPPSPALRGGRCQQRRRHRFAESDRSVAAGSSRAGACLPERASLRERGQGLGFPGCRVRAVAELARALSSAFGSGQPLLINTLVDPSSTAAGGA